MLRSPADSTLSEVSRPTRLLTTSPQTRCSYPALPLRFSRLPEAQQKRDPPQERRTCDSSPGDKDSNGRRSRVQSEHPWILILATSVRRSSLDRPGTRRYSC